MTIVIGDCLEVMKSFPDNHFSAIVTDPPYGLHFMGKDWDKFKYSYVGDHLDTRIRNGSMHAGKYDPKRDDEFQAFTHNWAIEAIRITTPGGHCLMFGAPRRYHRQVCALEDAGWEIRDCLMWVFGSGFPKSHNHFGIDGYGTALKPAYEIVIAAQKPLSPNLEQYIIVENLLKLWCRLCLLLPVNAAEEISTSNHIHLNEVESFAQWSVEQRSVTQEGLLDRMDMSQSVSVILSCLNTVALWKSTLEDHWNGGSMSTIKTELNRIIDLKTLKFYLSQLMPHVIIQEEIKQPGSWLTVLPAARYLSAVIRNIQDTQELSALESAISKDGLNLCPNYEPIIMAMKPLDGTFKQNAEKWGQAGINIDGCRIPSNESWKRDCRGQNMVVNVLCERTGIEQHSNSKGRWPANIIFDNFSEQILCLKSSIPSDIITAIEEYYHDYKLPNLSEENKNISKSCKKEQSTVLQPFMLQSSIDRIDERKSSPDERKEASERFNRKNAQTPCEEGKEQSNISRILVQSGISLCESSESESTPAINCQTDDQKTRNCGTSDYHGHLPESTSKEIRGCASSERRQRRQSHREPRDDGQLDPQKGTQGNSEGTSVIEVRERTLKVLACDVPKEWMKYFEETGEEIRSPNCAAQMLDEQNGNLTSGRLDRSKITAQNKTYGASPKELFGIRESSSGGASRFFYCAKTSPSERSEGMPEGQRNIHPTIKPLALMQYLIKLVMPPKDGLLLDPFAGSGSTIVAAKRLGFQSIGIEKSEEYATIARARIEAVKANEQMDLFG